MFTGIVEEMGAVVGLDAGAESARLTVRATCVTGSTAGDSVSINGVCLTAVDVDGDTFVADVMQETLQRTALRGLSAGDPVNVELAATLQTRLGGHLVQGHVDGIGTVVARQPGDRWETVTVELPGGLSRYVVEKGSIALDGVSLTVTAVDGNQLSVSLIPETLRRTTLGCRDAGDVVNVEVDVLAKHVERLLAARTESTS